MPQLIAHNLIRPNDWNVNAFDPENYPKLVQSVRQSGILEPIKLMPDPEREGEYLIVDGFHRWKAAGEIGLAEVPSEIWTITPEEAKVRGLQLNYLRGQPVPVRLAGLIHDLNATLTVNDLAKMLPWSESQLKDSLELLKLPADLQSKLEAQAAQDAAQAPIPTTVVLLGEEHQHFERAMELAKSRLGLGARRGECLAAICAHYLPQTSDGSVEGAGAASGSENEEQTH